LKWQPVITLAERWHFSVTTQISGIGV